MKKAQTLTKTYKGKHDVAVAKFRKDAAAMAKHGYYPSTENWVPGTWGCGSFIIVFILTCLGWIPGVIAALIINNNPNN